MLKTLDLKENLYFYLNNNLSYRIPNDDISYFYLGEL